MNGSADTIAPCLPVEAVQRLLTRSVVGWAPEMLIWHHEHRRLIERDVSTYAPAGKCTFHSCLTCLFSCLAPTPHV